MSCYRVVGVGRDLQEITSSKHPASAGWAAAGCPGPMSSQVLSISTGRDFITPLANLLQFLITFTMGEVFFCLFSGFLFVFKVFSCIQIESPFLNLCPVPPVSGLCWTVSFPPVRNLYILIRSPWAFSFQTEEYQLSQPLLMWRIFQSLNYLSMLIFESWSLGSCWTLS